MKRIVSVLIWILMIFGIISCSKPSSDNTINIGKVDYSCCNATSRGNMAEIESGFYYLLGSQLYYADRSDMSTWVLVCNKPDCLHKVNDIDCHANIGYEITQKDDNIYFYEEDLSLYPSKGIIYQIEKGGSEPIKVFELPLDYSGEHSGRSVISQEDFFIYHSTLEEDGFYKKVIYRLEEDGSLHTLFSKKYEEDISVLTIPSYLNQVRGDFTIMSSLLTEKGEDAQNVLFRVDGDVPERVNLPKDVLVLWSYLTEDTFTYYKPNQGFFEIDLESQTEICIMENQLSDARGYALTQEYFLECNRYQDNKPEEAYLKFYDGAKWIDVALPEVVKKTDCYFSPVSVATDRVFLTLDNGVANQLYYFMLGQDNPTLTLAMTIGDERYFNIKDSEDESNGLHKVDVTIFDTKECLAKVTEIGFDINEPDTFAMKVYFENKTDNTLTMKNSHISLNGVSFMLAQSITVKPHKILEQTYSVSTISNAGVDCMSELTNVLLSSYIYNDETYEKGPITITAIYPYGEENATVTVREPLPTDEILIDNEFIKLTAIQYWGSENKAANVKFILENKTDNRVMIETNEIISINGKSLNHSISHTGVIMPRSYGYYDIQIYDVDTNETIKELIGNEVKEYSINLRLYEEVGIEREIIWEEAILLTLKQ